MLTFSTWYADGSTVIRMSNSVQQIRFINFWFSKFLLVQIGANILPHDNSSHFDFFGHDYWEIICLEHWQNWVLIPYLTILFSEQFQKKIIIFTRPKFRFFLLGRVYLISRIMDLSGLARVTDYWLLNVRFSCNS